MKKEIIIVIIIILTLGSLGTIVYTDNPYAIEDNKEQLALSQEEKHWINKKREITIGVSSNLLYLASQEGSVDYQEGFLADYFKTVSKCLNVDADLVPLGTYEDTLKALEEGSIDCAVVVVNDTVRQDLDKLSITKPFLEIRNSIFLSSHVLESENYEKGQSFTGIVVDKSVEVPIGQEISYNKVPFILLEAQTVNQAVEMAIQGQADGIIGDEQAISAYLRSQNLLEEYLDLDYELGRQNVCIIMKNNQLMLYDMMNQVVQKLTASSVIGQLQSKWFGISYSLERENRFKDFTILMLIVFAAVLCAFFLYYLSNKNLYEELTARMEQLTASKREMDTTFNGVSYYMAELDPDGIVIDVNKAFLKFIKQINTKPIGLHIWNTMELPEDLGSKLQKEIEKTVEKNMGQHIELLHGKIILDINTFPIENSKANIEKILFMASDVTGVRMAERQMIQNNKMIAVGQLAAGVAHEIRNPLGLIRNYCYVLKTMNPKDEEQEKQAIQIIEKSVETSSKIITNLLNFSRINTMDKESVYVRNHIDSVVSLNYGKSKKKQIKIYVNCVEDFMAKICVESLDMVLINLLSNAMDAIEESGKITIDIYKYEYDFGIIVTDTGEGIEEDLLKDIYNPFFTTKQHGQGNGLGLYIVYNEVHKMNGVIDVSSKVNLGTTFKITLPLNN
jgi:polar amino acid transport system substrate-binding protein